LLALKEVLPQMKKVKIYDLSKERSQHFEKEMKEYVPNVDIEIQDTAEQTVRDSDVFVTATVSKDPIIKSDWIAKGTLYLHVGGNEAEFNVYIQLIKSWLMIGRKLKVVVIKQLVICIQKGCLMKMILMHNLVNLLMEIIK